MKYVLYTEVKFANKTIKEYYLYQQGGRIVTTSDVLKAKKFTSAYEASQTLNSEKFNIEPVI